MKRSIICIIFAILIAAGGFFLPKLVDEFPRQKIMSTAPQEIPHSFDESLTLRVKFPDGVHEMSLRDYLVGVVSAEMPESFPPEAQKAQAIAARTFALRQNRKHPNADICTSSECCQGWSAVQNARSAEAVKQTDGLVITYEDKLIEATYFSCCEQRTESAVAVWGSDVPYLQSVESPDQSEDYTQSLTLPRAEFIQKLSEHFPVLPADARIDKISYTKGDGIDTAVIGGVEVPGTVLRSVFSLRSTQIDLIASGDEITLTTYGFGHRVGMSQHGAKALAEEGYGFADILSHYYQGVALQRLCMKKTPPSEAEEALFFAITCSW